MEQLAITFAPPAGPSREDTTPERKERRAYRTTDMNTIKQEYTFGWLKGPEVARRLGRSYKSFRRFLERNPNLRKNGQD